MVKKYYIRISDSEPVDLSDGVYFVVEEDTSSDSTEFYLVRKNEYERLVSQFNAFENDVTSEIQDIVDSYLQGGRTLERTQSTYQIISQDGNDSITYNELKNALDIGKGNHTHKTTQVTNDDALSNIGTGKNANQSTINSSINEKFKQIANNLNFKRVDMSTTSSPDYVAEGYVKDKLKIYETDIFVYVVLDWENAQSSYRRNGEQPYYYKDILKGAIPNRLRPKNFVSVMNSPPMDEEHNVNNGGGKLRTGNGLKITFNYDGTIDCTNISNTTVNVQGGGYQLHCSAIWLKKDFINTLEN